MKKDKLSPRVVRPKEPEVWYYVGRRGLEVYVHAGPGCIARFPLTRVRLAKMLADLK